MKKYSREFMLIRSMIRQGHLHDAAEAIPLSTSEKERDVLVADLLEALCDTGDKAALERVYRQFQPKHLSDWVRRKICAVMSA